MTGQWAKHPLAAVLQHKAGQTPKIIAHGDGELAKQIERIAYENGITVMQDPLLTELFCQLPIGEEIPQSLYRVVAELLSFVYKLEGKTSQGFSERC